MTELTEEDKQKLQPILDFFNGDYERFVKDKELRKEDFDFELMEQIVALAQSQDIQSRLHALDLIGDSEEKFPDGFVANLLIAQKMDENEDIRNRVKEIMEQRRKESFKFVRESITNWPSPYSALFDNLTMGINMTDAAFSQSKLLASQLKPLIDVPIRTIDPSIITGYKKSIEPLGPILDQLSNIAAAVSPISAINPMIIPIISQENPDLTISEALCKPSEEILHDLDEISSSENDIIFNYQAYPLLFKIEIILRDLINKRICIKHKSNIRNKVPEGKIKTWNERKTIEESHPHITAGYRLIDYSDFSDLKEIFLKGKNKDEFTDLCSQEQFRNIISKLDELDPIRKKIAHSRLLTKDEFVRLQVYAKDIQKLFSSSEYEEKLGNN